LLQDLLEELREAFEDRYAIVREIGRGGMATVFLAEERHPRRLVAIKLFDLAFATNQGHTRFIGRYSSQRRSHIRISSPSSPLAKRQNSSIMSCPTSKDPRSGFASHENANLSWTRRSASRRRWATPCSTLTSTV